MSIVPSMTRAHFKLIAETILEMSEGSTHMDLHLTPGQVATSFARALRATNSRFDTEKFLRECGVSD